MDWRDEVEAMRPELVEQQARMREALACAQEELRHGTQRGSIERLTTGEVHLYLGIEIGPDYLVDALTTAWSMLAEERSVEDVEADLNTRRREGRLLPVGRSEDEELSTRMLPHVSSLAAGIRIWDGVDAEEYLKLSELWIRGEGAGNMLEVYAQEHGVSLYQAVRAGLVLLSNLEEVLLEEMLR